LACIEDGTGGIQFVLFLFRLALTWSGRKSFGDLGLDRMPAGEKLGLEAGQAAGFFGNEKCPPASHQRRVF
jgi:hypothetical protein